MFEIPEGLHPDLMGLAWMVGRWEGHGRGTWPDEGDFEFGQILEISHNGGPYLHYISQLFTLDEGGQPLAPRSMETGFWRPKKNEVGITNEVEVVMVHPEGYAEVWYGHIEGAKIELVTDSVMRTMTAEKPYVGGQRLFGNVEGDLLWTFDRATEDERLQSYMWARLQRGEQTVELAEGEAPVVETSVETPEP